MVPVEAGPSETNSTACTSRTSGTMSRKRLDDVGVRRGFRRTRPAVVVGEDEPVEPARTWVEALEPTGHALRGNHSRSWSGSRRAAKTRCTSAFTTSEAESVRAIVAPSQTLLNAWVTAMAGVTRSVRVISTSPVLAFGVAVAVIARTERAICSASSRSVCRPRVGPDGTLHLDNRYPGRGQLPRAAQESVSGAGGGRAGPRTHPHASHDAAPSLTYWTSTHQTHP